MLLSSLENLLGTDEYGTSLESILRPLCQQGLNCRIITHARLRDLRKAVDAGQPALISTSEGEHWAVVYGYSRGYVFVSDPSLSAICCSVPLRRFRKRWDGWVMEVKL